MYNLWSGKNPFPNLQEMQNIENATYIDVHTAIPGEYQFLLGAAIIKHQNKWYASWGNSLRNENDDNTMLALKTSEDGINWEDYKRISDKTPGYGRSHGVFLEHEGRLYAFCPKARYDKIDAYPDLKMEVYRLEDDHTWCLLGIALDDCFWPMCQPLKLADGSYVMAGLKTTTSEGAVALCDGEDVTKWEIRTFPNPQGFEYWGETTVLKQQDKLVALIRNGGPQGCILVSESTDGGKTWSDICESDIDIVNSKMYAGTLSDGRSYLVYSAPVGEFDRDTLCILTGKDTFDRAHIVRHGFAEPPKFWRKNEWCYPYAYEDTEEKKLYVVYARNKEDCELAIIPTYEI